MKTVSSADTFTFPAGSTQHIKNKITLRGTTSNQLTVDSSSGDTDWNLNGNTFNSTIEYVTLSDANNVNGGDMYCFPGCVDSSNNTNWLFIERPIPREAYRLRGGTRFDGGMRF